MMLCVRHGRLFPTKPFEFPPRLPLREHDSPCGLKKEEAIVPSFFDTPLTTPRGQQQSQQQQQQEIKPVTTMIQQAGASNVCKDLGNDDDPAILPTGKTATPRRRQAGMYPDSDTDTPSTPSGLLANRSGDRKPSSAIPFITTTSPIACNPSAFALHRAQQDISIAPQGPQLHVNSAIKAFPMVGQHTPSGTSSPSPS